ncbi:MAG TPA: hypothetical protein PL041_15365, partial [Melioribacteraceae bacterium]|nr:hypothetical protein [Melioribacteraceae bacterium]
MKNKTILIFILFITVNLFGQKKLSFEFDYAQFAYDSTSNYVELYFSFDQTGLTLQKGDTSIITAGRIYLNIKDTLNSSIIDREFRASSQYKENSETKLLVTKMAVALKPGLYTIKIIAKDDNDTTKVKTIEEKIKVTLFLIDEIRVSDIQLARTI